MKSGCSWRRGSGPTQARALRPTDRCGRDAGRLARRVRAASALRRRAGRADPLRRAGGHRAGRRRRWTGSTRSSRRSTPSPTSPTRRRWRRRGRSAPATRARSPGCRSRSRTTAPVAGMPLTMGSDLFGDYVARSRRLPGAAAARGRVRDRRQDGAAGDGDPADDRVAALRAHPQPVGPRTARPAAPAAARRRRWPPAWSRSPTATTAAARSGSRRPAAAWSGSSRPAAGSRSGPTPGRASSSPTACSPATVADTAARARRARRL